MTLQDAAEAYRDYLTSRVNTVTCVSADASLLAELQAVPGFEDTGLAWLVSGLNLISKEFKIAFCEIKTDHGRASSFNKSVAVAVYNSDLGEWHLQPFHRLKIHARNNSSASYYYGRMYRWIDAASDQIIHKAKDSSPQEQTFNLVAEEVTDKLDDEKSLTFPGVSAHSYQNINVYGVSKWAFVEGSTYPEIHFGCDAVEQAGTYYTESRVVIELPDVTSVFGDRCDVTIDQNAEGDVDVTISGVSLTFTSRSAWIDLFAGERVFVSAEGIDMLCDPYTSIVVQPCEYGSCAVRFPGLSNSAKITFQRSVTVGTITIDQASTGTDGTPRWILIPAPADLTISVTQEAMDMEQQTPSLLDGEVLFFNYTLSPFDGEVGTVNFICKGTDLVELGAEVVGSLGAVGTGVLKPDDPVEIGTTPCSYLAVQDMFIFVTDGITTGYTLLDMSLGPDINLYGVLYPASAHLVDCTATGDIDVWMLNYETNELEWVPINEQGRVVIREDEVWMVRVEKAVGYDYHKLTYAATETGTLDLDTLDPMESPDITGMADILEGFRELINEISDDGGLIGLLTNPKLILVALIGVGAILVSS